MKASAHALLPLRGRDAVFHGRRAIAGAVVHYPLDAPVYTVICIVGAVVFLLGSIVNEFILAPERSAAMTPIGLLMSYAAFVAKDSEGRWRHDFSLFGAASSSRP